MSPAPSRRVAIPRRLVLRGRRWKVSYTTHPGKRCGEPKGFWGYRDVDRRTIEIHPGISRREQELTFVHEIAHSFIPEGVIPEGAEEQIALALERGLYDALIAGALVAVPDEARRR